MRTHGANAESIARLRELIKGIKFAMLTTVEPDGTLRSRPMTVQETEFDGDLWFFTEADAPKVDEIQHDRQVNVAFAAPDDQRYISLSGTARLVRDVQKQRELWSEPNKIWFPNGPEDPNLALLKVTVTQAEYWEAGSNRIGRMIDFARAMITGDQRQVGENRKLDLGV
jgi:general stress protein 26